MLKAACAVLSLAQPDHIDTVECGYIPVNPIGGVVSDVIDIDGMMRFRFNGWNLHPPEPLLVLYSLLFFHEGQTHLKLNGRF